MPYGIVHFMLGGERGAQLQRTLTERLDAQGVITVPKATIEKWFEEDSARPYGSTNIYRLHDRSETDIFKAVMESAEMKDDKVKWEVSRSCPNKESREWFRNRRKGKNDE